MPTFTSLKRIVVSIDPATTAKEESNETGIIVAGLGFDNCGYILNDLSLRGSPGEWAKVAVDAYHDYLADRLVYETNQGGDMVAHTLRTIEQNIPLSGVHASRGKQARAEPVAALYEQGRIFHIMSFPELEDQMCAWVPGTGESPDRVDALVWALTELMLDGQGEMTVGTAPEAFSNYRG